MCPWCCGQAAHRTWLCGSVRELGGLYQAQQVAEGKQEVNLAIL